MTARRLGRREARHTQGVKKNTGNLEKAEGGVKFWIKKLPFIHQRGSWMSNFSFFLIEDLKSFIQTDLSWFFERNKQLVQKKKLQVNFYFLIHSLETREAGETRSYIIYINGEGHNSTHSKFIITRGL